jgi:hypothetical protein
MGRQEAAKIHWPMRSPVPSPPNGGHSRTDSSTSLQTSCSSTDADRDEKEIPRDQLGGRSPRQALIYVSEEVVKPAFGQDYFGRYAAQRLTPGALHIFSDGGFIKEIQPVIDAVGPENLLLVQLHRDGFSFEGDSRRYIPTNYVQCWTKLEVQDPDSTLAAFIDAIQNWIENGQPH